MSRGASRIETTSENRRIRTKARTSRSPPLLSFPKPNHPNPKGAMASNTISGGTRKGKMTKGATMMVGLAGEMVEAHGIIHTILARKLIITTTTWAAM